MEWRPVKGIQDRYEVSDTGMVRHSKTMRIRKPFCGKNGYLVVTAQKSLGVVNVFRLIRIHRVVAEAFIPNPDGKPEVNHINGNKTDNRVENLEWCTRSENETHAYRTGLAVHKRGQDWHRSILTEAQVKDIKSRYIPYTYSQYKLAKEYGVSRSAIMHIIAGDRWGHVS